MKNRTILMVRFPYVDSVKSIVDRVKRFESFFYNIFHLLVQRDELLSVEIAMVNGIINFYIVVPQTLVGSITALLFSEFPDLEISQVKNYDGIASVPKQGLGYRPKLIGSEAYTLRTIEHSKADPLNTFFNLLSGVHSTDSIFYQIVMEPIDESLGEHGSSSIYAYAQKEEAVEVKPKFNVTIRLLCLTADAKHMQVLKPMVENIFSPFSTERNYLKVKTIEDAQPFVSDYFNYRLTEPDILTTEEIASLFHSPDPAAKVRGMNWLYSRKAEPPMNLPTLESNKPDELSVFGVTNFRGNDVQFGITREDRRRHLYVVGKSGVGKSKLLEKLIADDILAHQGVCVIDPHGDLVQDVLAHIPKNRMDDVVYFNPSDLDFPIAFNPLENVDREYKQQVTLGLIEIFKKFFGADWTPKIEHVFRFTVLALLDYKKATLMSMQKMLTDRTYRQLIVSHIKDHIVKKFWATEFAGWSEKFDNEAIVPLINKLGQFLSNEMVRNIMAQSKNKVNFGDIMNRQRILLVELSKGKLGEENSSLLGSLIITKIEQEGMARAYLAQDKRKDFYLYVDEFQNFATKSFDNILSEARKYRLNLTVSHQYLGQLAASTRDTVFGNVSSMITFRLGADDAHYMEQELAPRFTGNDIMNLGVREMYLKMSVRGQVTPAFSAYSVDVPAPDHDAKLKEKIIDGSRKKYATPVADVEKEIEELYEKTGTQSPKAKEEAADEFEAPLI